MRKYFFALCKQCKKDFKFTSRNKNRKYCSKECYWDSLKGKKHSEIWFQVMRKRIPWNKGIKDPNIANDKHPYWKGDNVGYYGLHLWIKRHLGKPQKCRICGKEWDKPRSIHWANKDHSYKRDFNDWISLCVSCHKKYDLENNNKKNVYCI